MIASASPLDETRRASRIAFAADHPRLKRYSSRTRQRLSRPELVKCGEARCRCASRLKHDPSFYLRYQEWKPYASTHILLPRICAAAAVSRTCRSGRPCGQLRRTENAGRGADQERTTP